MVIAHATGGLVDTVTDLKEGGYGILMETLTHDQLCNAIQLAMEVYSDKKRLSQLRNEIIKLDFSWKASAEQYAREYLKLIECE